MNETSLLQYPKQFQQILKCVDLNHTPTSELSCADLWWLITSSNFDLTPRIIEYNIQAVLDLRRGPQTRMALVLNLPIQLIPRCPYSLSNRSSSIPANLLSFDHTLEGS